ncbi:MAG: TonB family protein [Acidiferrobacter sp.]
MARGRLSDLDRLGVAIFFAGLLEVIVILGVRFAPPPAARSTPLDVTLVQAMSHTPPHAATRLAQVNVRGGGGRHHSQMAHTPFAATRAGGGAMVHKAVRHNAPDHARHWRRLTAAQAPLQVTVIDPQWRLRAVLAEDLGLRHRFRTEEAHLQAEIRRDWRALNTAGSGRGGVNARRFAYAGYIARWTTYMQALGNHRYHAVLARAGVGGALVLNVAIRANGTLASVRIVRRAANPLLDVLALQLVRQAAPFPPLPAVTNAPLPILHIIETWRFRGHHLTDRTAAVSTGP